MFTMIDNFTEKNHLCFRFFVNIAPEKSKIEKNLSYSIRFKDLIRVFFLKAFSCENQF
jgi:hypothetical protein